MSTMPGSMAGSMPPPPVDDIAEIRSRTQQQAAERMEILSAVCGFVDCTESLREIVEDLEPGAPLRINSSTIDRLANWSKDGKTDPDEARSDQEWTYLTFIFRYGGPTGPLQLFVSRPSSSGEVYTVSPKSTEYPVVVRGEWNPITWSIVAIVYGANHVTNPGAASAVMSEIKESFQDGKGTRRVKIVESLVRVVSGLFCLAR